MAGLEEAIEAVLVEYGVPVFLTYKNDDSEGGADRGDLASALAAKITDAVQIAYLGGRYRDTLTGFAGVAVGVWHKVGSTQVQIARVGNDGKIHHEWIGAARLDVVGETSPGVYR